MNKNTYVNILIIILILCLILAPIVYFQCSSDDSYKRESLSSENKYNDTPYVEMIRNDDNYTGQLCENSILANKKWCINSDGTSNPVSSPEECNTDEPNTLLNIQEDCIGMYYCDQASSIVPVGPSPHQFLCNHSYDNLKKDMNIPTLHVWLGSTYT